MADTDILFLTHFPADQKVTIIKLVQEVTGLNLKDAKDGVERLPMRLEVLLGQGAKAQAMLEESGATVETRDPPSIGEPLSRLLMKLDDQTCRLRDATGVVSCVGRLLSNQRNTDEGGALLVATEALTGIHDTLEGLYHDLESHYKTVQRRPAKQSEEATP
jgi:hypothetical protein